MLSEVKISTPEADGQGNVTYRKDGQLNGYNGSGQRVSREDFIWNDKDSDGQIDVTGDDLTDERENEYETKFYYTGSAILYTANSNNYLLTENILDPGGKIIASARFDFGNPDVPDDYFFYNYDKRGSTTAILQPDGSLKTGYEYDEFGNLEQSGDAGFLNDTTFTGSVTDKSTGLQYMNARHYNPATGRFLSQDSYTGNPYDPWTQHLYSYCGNNPTSMVDPTGHFFFLIGGLIGGIVGGIDAAINGEDFWAGVSGGAVTGAIMGAATDITIASGGTLAPVAVAAIYAGTGLLGGGLGNATTQVHTSMNQGSSFNEAVNDINYRDVYISAGCGAVANLASMGAGNVLREEILDPVINDVVDQAAKYAANEIVDWSYGELVKTATKTTLLEIGVNTGINTMQNVTYRGLKRISDGLLEELRQEKFYIKNTSRSIKSSITSYTKNAQAIKQAAIERKINRLM